MVEVIIGGTIALVSGAVGAVVQHLLQRMRNKDERKARREEIIYEKQLSVFEDAVKTLAVMDNQWRVIFRATTDVERLIQMTEVAKQTVLDSLELKARISAYMTIKAGRAWLVYNTGTMELSREVVNVLLSGGRVNLEEIESRLDDLYSSAVLTMREQLGIKES